MVLSNEDYEKFVKKNKINEENDKKHIMNTDSDGYIVLDKKNYLSSNMPLGNSSFGKEWIGLNSLQLALVKERIPDRKEYEGIYTNVEKEILIANNFILPELAKQFGLEAAKYYQVKYRDSDKIYLLTPSFLKEDEELIHLSNIVGNENLCIPSMLGKIEFWLADLGGYNREDIDVIKIKFLKQSIFNRFIEFTDEHNDNAGIIVNGENRTARMAPIYDIDFSARVYNQSPFGLVINHRYTKDRYSVELEDILNCYKDLPWIKEYIQKVLEKININVALEKGQKNGNLTLSEKAKTKYKEFFEEQISVLEEFIQELNQEEGR